MNRKQFFEIWNCYNQLVSFVLCFFSTLGQSWKTMATVFSCIKKNLSSFQKKGSYLYNGLYISVSVATPPPKKNYWRLIGHKNLSFVCNWKDHHQRRMYKMKEKNWIEKKLKKKEKNWNSFQCVVIIWPYPKRGLAFVLGFWEVICIILNRSVFFRMRIAHSRKTNHVIHPKMSSTLW